MVVMAMDVTTNGRLVKMVSSSNPVVILLGSLPARFIEGTEVFLEIRKSCRM